MDAEAIVYKLQNSALCGFLFIIKSMNNISISKPEPEDAEDILHVLYRTWLDTYPNNEYKITKEDIEDSYRDSFLPENIEKLKNNIRNTSDECKRIIAKADGKVVGTGMMADSSIGLRLKTLYILPEYQGNGIGKRIWDELAKQFNSNKKIYVELAIYNERALNFYKKLGFKDTGRRFVDNDLKIRRGVSIPQMEMVLER